MRITAQLRSVALLVCLAIATNVSQSWAEQSSPEVHSLQDQIRVLIERLGSPRFVRRQLAADELRRLGEEAIDQLLQAQYVEQAEISLSARQLLGEVAVDWVQSDDPTIVEYIMKDFGQRTERERLYLADWLARLEDGVGIPAICRIVRYDPSELLAKQAALMLLLHFDQDDLIQREQLISEVDRSLLASNRRPANWLRLATADLQRANHGGTKLNGGEVSGTSLSAWRQFLEDEQLQVDGPRSNEDVLANLVRWFTDRSVREQNIARVREGVQIWADLRADEPFELLVLSVWLLDHHQIPIFRELIYDRFTELRQQQPLFLYLAAEAERVDGNEAAANELADQAFQLTEPNSPAFGDAISAFERQYNSATHLERRGQVEWAVREYRRVIDSKDVPGYAVDNLRGQAVQMLSEMYHDLQRDKDAADTLAARVEDVEDLIFEEDGLESEMRSILSRYYFFRSEQHRQLSDREKQIEFLKKGIAADPTDADVLIAMYRLPRADDAWREMTRERIQNAVRVFETKLELLRSAGVVNNRFPIATELNQLAWLVGNTEGDQQRAVQQSIESLELRPQSAGSLDTLGRAYFAIGDLDRATKYQRRAVKLEPRSHQIRRQLDEFEQQHKQRTQAP